MFIDSPANEYEVCQGWKAYTVMDYDDVDDQSSLKGSEIFIICVLHM
ncbi:protein of unknown function (plasmid) [Vibrio harveyi]|nr:protein of unknown function [Vibrio harveyi]